MIRCQRWSKVKIDGFRALKTLCTINLSSIYITFNNNNNNKHDMHSFIPCCSFFYSFKAIKVIIRLCARSSTTNTFVMIDALKYFLDVLVRLNFRIVQNNLY